MADENHDDEELSPALEAKVLERFKPLKEERGRTTGVGTAFYDKLAALNAGSIALFRWALQSSTSKNYAISPMGLLGLILCFWLSLLAAIAHNFLLLWSAKLDAAYASDEFVKDTLKTMFRHVQITPGTDPNEWKQVQGFALEESIKKQRITYARKQRCESAAEVAAVLSINFFFIGYTVVVIGAWRLWR